MPGESLDALDARLLLLLTDSPRLGVLECARRLGVARGTVQARLDRLAERGVLGGFPPELDIAAMGLGRHGCLYLSFTLFASAVTIQLTCADPFSFS